MVIEELQARLAERVRAWARERSLPPPGAMSFSAPPAHVPADLCLPWPLQAAKLLKRPPLEIAGELAAVLGDDAGVEAARPAPPGYVNLRLSSSTLEAALDAAAGSPATFGASPGARRRKILIEFVSANPTGPLHLASGRAATLGDSLARILGRIGHEAGKECYVNDVGRQVELLGLSVRARWEELQGRQCPLPEGGYQGDYVRDLASGAPPEACGWDPAAFARFAVESLLAEQRRDLEAFGVRFDRWFRESELHASGAVESALASLKSRGMAYDKDGAVWLGSSSTGPAPTEPGVPAAPGAPADDKDRVLVRSDGRPTYFLADIAYHKDKYDRGWEELVDIWGADHHGYVPRMRAAVAALGRAPDSFHPLIHQLVHLTRGKEPVKMSKRAGRFVALRELVEEAGVDACRFFFSQRTPNSHMNFDVELAKKQSQENPVYYVQYVHARVCSIFREAVKSGLAGGTHAPPAEQSAPPTDLLPRGAPDGHAPPRTPEERALLVQIARFPGALAACEAALSPHPLPAYLLELAGLFHPFYEKCRVLDRDDLSTTRSRLRLCEGVRCVIREGLGLLGVSAPESM